jgi:putative transposase
MPRKSRVDAPGAIHHVIARGIERRELFLDDDDRESFLSRLATVITETKTTCYAWALIPNHFHLLVKTGSRPIATVMRRLLTGYAMYFNGKYKRSGHLFQNRYESILCQEDAYLLELVRYIHLNPLRAGLVSSFDDLGKYAYGGHSVIKGKTRREWQDADYVLSLFADKLSIARRRYGLFAREGIAMGKRDDLTGGGLIRSYGGWEEVTRMRKAKDFQKSDERILGDGAFVEKALAHSGERAQERVDYRLANVPYQRVAEIAAKQYGVPGEMIFAKTKQRSAVKARYLYCFWLARELNASLTEISRTLGMSLSTVSQGVEKGAILSDELSLSLVDEISP